jgi:TolB protein
MTFSESNSNRNADRRIGSKKHRNNPNWPRRCSALRFATLLAVAIGFAATAQAQSDTVTVTRDITPGNEKPIPVHLSGFTGEAASVIQFDLFVQGFKFTGPDEAQFLLSGSNGANLVGRASDRINKSTFVNKSYTGATLRRQAHAFVDDFLAAIGRKGLGGSKIAFKVDTGANSEIYVADFDGHDAQAITSDNTIVAAPAWRPGRLALYYTSYKFGNPDIFFHDLNTGARDRVAYYPGLNTSAAPSPDGSKIAMILSKGGSPDVYVSDADGKNLKRLTSTKEDESSPCWSPDGQWICFATKINARRVLCKVPASGGPVQRISTAGVSNPSEPDWSPDGKWIVFTAQMGGFEICVVPATGGTATLLVSGEDPSWGPNSRTVVYARRQGGRRTLSLLDVPTKQTKDVSRISASNSQPSWAK